MSGKIIRPDIIPGLCFSQLYYKDDENSYLESQPYLAHVATRSVVLIDTETPIGKVGFIAIGMTEVSTVELSVNEGESVTKGQSIGTFRFGGSSHLLMFENDVNITFDLKGIEPSINGKEFLKVNSTVAKFAENHNAMMD